MAFYIVAAEEQGVSARISLAGTIQNDILEGVHGTKHLHISTGKEV